MKPQNITQRERDLPDIGKHPDSYWRADDMWPDLKPVYWRGMPGQIAPDLSDCLARRLPGRQWLLQIWEPLLTHAPSPARRKAR